MRVPLRRILNCFALGMAATGYPITLAAQERADRALLDSFLTSAQAALTPAALPALSACDNRHADVVRLCQGVIALYRGRLTNQRADVIAANDLIVRAVSDQEKWPHAWLLLGMVRLQLAHDTVFSREGPGLPPGMSNLLGAANAFTEALRLDPSFARAAEALALAPEPREGPNALMDRVALLRRYRSVLSPRANAATAILERDAGSADSAIALELRALASGKVDSGVVLLSLARDLYYTEHPKDARVVLLTGASIATPSAKQAYRDELAWIATANELAQWDALAPVDRSDWVAKFWAKRDVTEGRPDGARLIEHYRRVEYAMAHFRLALPQVGRQRFLSFTTAGGPYAAEEKGREYALHHPDLCPDAARFANDAKELGADSPFRYYQPVQDLVDDRGTIWIRHGPPTKSRTATGGDPAEIWRYERPEGAMVLQFRAADFQGTSGASVLVPSLLSISPGLRSQICDLDAGLCPAAAKPGPMQPGDTSFYTPDLVACTKNCPVPIDPITHLPIKRVGKTYLDANASETCREPIARVLERFVRMEGGNLSTGAFVHTRLVGRDMIDRATTTDSYHRDFAKTIHPALQLFGLDRAAGGSPRIVVAFALPGNELGFVWRDSGDKRVVYPVTIQVMTVDARSGMREDVDTLRQFITSGPLVAGQFITGILELPISPGRYTASVVFTQTDGHGAIAHLDEIAVPGDKSQLTVSDLVLGRENSGVQWNSGATSVALNPLNTYPKGGAAEVYFQLSGLSPGTSYQSKFEIFRADDDPKRAPRLAISFTQPATESRIEVSRTLGLQQLDPGRYRVKLTVSGGGHETNAVAWLTIVK